MFSESMTWGVLPVGFQKLCDRNGNRMVVRCGREHEIDFSL